MHNLHLHTYIYMQYMYTHTYTQFKMDIIQVRENIKIVTLSVKPS